MKLLVTGGAGFIGSNFIRYWLGKYPDDEIVNFDKLTYAGHLESLKDVADNPKYSFVKGDICDSEAVGKAMGGVDIVVHFAAETHVDRSVIDPLTFVKTNVVGSTVVLQAALKNKVKHFHHISTDEVFGELGPDDPLFNEDTNYKPRTPYSASKAGSDLIVRAYFETYGLPITITNCANNFGPYLDPEKFIARFITNLLEGKKVPLMGRGENIRPWLFVEDHCLGIDLVIKKGKLGQTYCIGGEEKTNIEVTRLILKLLRLDESMIEFVEDRLGHDFRYGLDSTKIQALGWQPEHNFRESLEKTVEWFKQNKDWWKPLKEGRPIVDRVAQTAYSHY